MISLSESLLTGLLRRSTAAPPAFEPPAEADAEGRTSSPDALASDDPFFLAVAEALQEAGYLDS